MQLHDFADNSTAMGMIFCRHLHLRLFVVNGVKVKSLKNALFLACCTRRRRCVVASCRYLFVCQFAALRDVAKNFTAATKKNQMKKETQCWENNNNSNNNNNCLRSLKQVFFRNIWSRLFCYHCCCPFLYVFRMFTNLLKCMRKVVDSQLFTYNCNWITFKEIQVIQPMWILLTCK